MRPKTFRFGVEGEAARSESPERDRRAVSVARHQSGGLVTVFSETRGDNVVGLPDSGIGGKAASAAFDPFDVSSGEYLYAPTISAAFQMDEIGDFGGIVFFALDSRLSSRAAVDLFYERGQPFSEALWAMSITTRGRLVSDSDNDLNVRFSINPIARSPGSAGQRPILDPSVSDEDIGAAIKSRFHVADGTAILEESPFFPTGTMYRVDANGVDGPTRFGFGVNAGLTTAVPGPSALALLLIGGLTLRAVVACRSSAANAVDGGMGEALLRPRLSPPFRRRPDL